MSSWNDDRLDKLSGRVDTGFAKVDKRFERVESEMREGFARVDKRFEQIDRRFEQLDRRLEQFATREEMAEVRTDLRLLNQRFDRLLHTLVLISWGVAGSLLTALVALIVVLI